MLKTFYFKKCVQNISNVHRFWDALVPPKIQGAAYQHSNPHLLPLYCLLWVRYPQLCDLGLCHTKLPQFDIIDNFCQNFNVWCAQRRITQDEKHHFYLLSLRKMPKLGRMHWPEEVSSPLGASERSQQRQQQSHTATIVKLMLDACWTALEITRTAG